MTSPETAPDMPVTPIGLAALARYFLHLGATGFGGPVALCGLMERDLVERRGWLGAAELRDMIAVCQSMPGPLAVQVGIFVGYRFRGFWGAWVAGGALILPASVMVTVLAAAYARLGDLPWVTAIVYGVNPAVIALILQSWWRLVRLGMADRFQWSLAGLGLAATFALAGQLPLVFLAAGAVGALWYRTRPQGTAPLAVIASPWALGKLAGYFFVTGSVSFGSALAVVPLLETGLVQQGHWLTAHDFLVAVAAGMLTPGPIMTIASFAGYLVAGLPGAALCTVAVFLPSFLLVLLVAPPLLRHRGHRLVQGFLKGVYAAAIGAILGAAALLGRGAIGDWLTALIAAGGLAALVRFRIGNPLLVGIAAAIGLAAFPLLHPAWVLAR
ncbi:MAG: chromate transporter [Rhodospirillales bacterium]|nr:chromate transporter [Rhodospirillales bacterium]